MESDRPSTRPLLSIERYNRIEKRESLYLSIPHLMAFRPISYLQVGWPEKIHDVRELARFADHNFEGEITGLFVDGARFDPVGYRNSFSLDERDLLDTVRNKVRWFTESWFDRRIAPVSNILVQMGPFRMLRQLGSAFGLERLSVFEAGPGAGYLGAFLSETGHRYISYEITQSYYLWQSCLMQAISDNNLVELALGEDAGEGTANAGAIGTVRDVHIPWWKFASMLTGTPMRADVVYSNSNLSEMSRVSLRMLLHTSKTILQDSDLGAFTFFSKGMPAQTPHEMLDEEFAIFGYHKALEEPFHAYTLKQDKVEVIQTAFQDGIHDYDPSGRGGSLTANDVVTIHPYEAPLDTQLTQWFHGWQPPFVKPEK